MKVMKILHSLNFPYYTKHGWVYEARLLKIFKRNFFSQNSTIVNYDSGVVLLTIF